MAQSQAIETKHLSSVLEKHGNDMSGKVVAITGTTSGTGFVCAREVAKKGAKVILLNRRSERSASSLVQLQEAVPSAAFDAVDCDLQDFESVRAAAAAVKGKYEVVDVLVNNAGVMGLRDQATKDGYDVQMQTNAISHFLLTKELFPLLRASKQARIVNHTSGARLGEPLEMRYFEKNGGHLGGDGNEMEASAEGMKFEGGRWKRYHQTKLANCCFTYGLKNKLGAAGITNVLPLLAHPGVAATQLSVATGADGGLDGLDMIDEMIKMAQSAEDGATGIIRACMDPEAKAGNFYGPSAWTGFPEVLEPEELLSDEKNVSINWDGCEKAVGTFTF